MIFASELKALVAAVGPELRTDPGALIASMLYYWLPEQHCAIEGVEKLPPGSWAEFRPDGTSRHETYWRVADVATEAAAGPPRRPAPVIEESVAAHLVADVPVSTFLSGGLDSSLVTVLAKRTRSRHRRLHDHLPGARTRRSRRCPTTRSTPARWPRSSASTCTRSRSRPDVVELLPRIVDILDEPIGDPAAINTLLMCDTARDAGVKVLLSGMGADELFGGYRKHLACVMGARYQRLPGVLRNGLIGPAVRRLPVTVERPRPAVRALGEALPHLRGPARGGGVPAQLHDVRRATS